MAVAAATSSYSRIANTPFKNLPDYILHYADTDSLYFNKPLSDNLVSATELGKLKLEGIYNKGIFIAPKVYCLLTNKNEFISKVKGLKSNDLTMTDFEHLLTKNNSINKPQEIWK